MTAKKDKEMNFFAVFFEKMGKKMYRGENPRYIQKCIKNLKKIGLIIADWLTSGQATRWVRGRRTQNQKHAGGLTPR